MTDITKNIIKKLSCEIMNAKEKVIEDAVIHHLGEHYILEEVKRRGAMLITPDLTQRLFIDGVLLVEFYPPDHTPPSMSDGFKFYTMSTFRYREFYKDTENDKNI